MDKNLKAEAEELFACLGMNMTTAIAIFLRKAVEEQGLPFPVNRRPNTKTLEALNEARRIANDPKAKTYTDLNELFADLHADYDFDN